MATFRRVGDKWKAEVCVKGKRKSRSWPTKAQAKSWAIEQEVELGQLADGVSTHHTLADIFKRYADEVSTSKKGAHWEIIRLKKFESYTFSSIKLVDLKREDIESWMLYRLKEVKSSSVNRELNLLSHCLTQARRWRLMNHNPMVDLKRPKNPPHRDRRISQEEIDQILVALNYTEDFELTMVCQRVAVAFLFALETAMRASEICSLMPGHLNLVERTALLATTKNGLPRYVPLSEEAIRLLKRLQPWGDTLFDVKSGTLSTLFKKAVSKTDIQNLTFHDTRHEAITRLAKKIDVLDLARMVGHRDIKQLMTYYNKSAADLAKLL